MVFYEVYIYIHRVYRGCSLFWKRVVNGISKRSFEVKFKTHGFKIQDSGETFSWNLES